MKTMNRRLTTVAIGLPAYNEEANIGHLLEDIYAQAEDGFIIDRVIVASDGSTDRTAEIARNSGRKTIVFDNPTRQGVAVRQNQILEYAEADILVILNADIRLFDRAFLRKIIEPVIREQADLSSGNYSAITPRTWVGQALAVGLEMKNQVYAAYRQGDNFYTCHGTARAFSRRLYKRLRFKESIGEDAYSYFYVKSRGFKYAFAPAAVLHIYLPENRRDYLRQTVRFIKTPARAGRDFSPDLVASELKLPRLLLARSLARSLGRNPFYTLVFLFLYGWARLSARCERPGSPDWEIASSTKKPRGGPPADGIVFGLRLALFFRNLGYRLIRLLNEMKLEVYPRLFILCYHSVSAGGWRYSVNPDEFKRQIDWLLANFAPLSLSRAAAFLAGGRLPEKNSFVLTFDDGYADNSDIAEFLHGRGITPAIFLLASPEAADRHELSTEQGLLDWASAGKLAVQGWEIGCHSATHANFASLDEAELKKEIMGAKKQLEKRLGTRIDYFSYPKGEYNEVARSIVSEAGYKLAVTMDDHIISRNSDRLAWPRIGVDGTHGFKDFKILFSRTAIHFRQVVKTAVKYKARFASYWRHKTEKKDRTPACRENFGIWQKLLLFFVNRLVTEDKIKRAALPDALKGYRLRSIIDRPKGDNQYQFGIYENENGAKGILKMWDGTRRDGDWFWLANEIRTYEGLADLSRACGSALEEKFPRIKLPRFISSFNTNDRLGLFVEMIEGVTLDKESSVENRAKYFEEVIEYFRHLGELIMRFGQDKKFVRRQNIHTVLIYFYMLVRSAWMYPRIIPRLAHGLALFLSDLPYLAADRSLAFVHRDLTYMNVLKLSDGRIGVIDFELAVVTNPLYEVTQAVTGSWHLENFCREFYRRRLVKEILADKNKRHCYRALTIFTGVHRLATSPAKEFASHYSYYKHGLGLVRPEPKLSRENTVTAPVADKN